MQRRLRAAFAACAFLALSLQAAGADRTSLTPLHVISAENRSGRAMAADGPVRLRLTAADARKLADALGADVPAGQASFEYIIDEYQPLPGAGTRTWLEPTFVIDFTEAAFDSLREELDARGSKVTRPQLVQYVADLIDESSDRGWDIASVVASRRRGDCSEHAVLTAALARMQGIPARVVVGVALVSRGEDFGAFGHAWAETLEGGKWKVADAALFGMDATVRYLPLGLMEDESTGFGLSLFGLMRIWVERVVLLGPA